MFLLVVVWSRPSGLRAGVLLRDHRLLSPTGSSHRPTTIHHFDGENLVALVIFLFVGGVVSVLLATASRRTVEAGARAARGGDARRAQPAHCRRPTTHCPQLSDSSAGVRRHGVAVLKRAENDESWHALAPPAPPAAATTPTTPTSSSPARHRGAGLRSATLGDDDRDVCGPSPLRWRSRSNNGSCEPTPSGRRVLRRQRVRTALLAAVSHDLRTPLSSIKASVSSLLPARLRLNPARHMSCSRPIDEGADRLNHLIGNLST